MAQPNALTESNFDDQTLRYAGVPLSYYPAPASNGQYTYAIDSAQGTSYDGYAPVSQRVSSGTRPFEGAIARYRTTYKTIERPVNRMEERTTIEYKPQQVTSYVPKTVKRWVKVPVQRQVIVEEEIVQMVTPGRFLGERELPAVVVGQGQSQFPMSNMMVQGQSQFTMSNMMVAAPSAKVGLVQSGPYMQMQPTLTHQIGSSNVKVVGTQPVPAGMSEFHQMQQSGYASIGAVPVMASPRGQYASVGAVPIMASPRGERRAPVV